MRRPDDRTWFNRKALAIAELFDDFLVERHIRVPSDDPWEEDDREPDNEAAIYGVAFWQLMNEIEEILMEE